jgi:hypothetical protein
MEHSVGAVPLEPGGGHHGSGDVANNDNLWGCCCKTEGLCNSLHPLQGSGGVWVFYMRDVGYRTPNLGWLVKSNLNLSPCDVGDLLTTITTKGGVRGGGGGTTLTTNGDNCEYINERGDKDGNNCNGLLLLFMLERDLLLETPVTMGIGIICPRESLGLPPSSPPLLSSSCQSILPLSTSPSSSPMSSI